ncbi:hypothetical protein EKQ61_01580 [Staphylococcus gallinarum]|uniref:Putative gp48 n=1 Tax=Staphylococcus gallinarum TaxID=1293 RepID=A0A0D0RL77_STAGA|nr:hypothetical protein [Staphylococcus gallinarum]KIR10677.1 hypothetical protein SH09_10955 [Staphylococcus gallinarum]RTX82882.1 hypothetical protein EKQ61_01580 [Staphylococcus gallinarum]GEQ04570.1 hypothetical protein SGA02_03980 [Staphylococcus gallinarum]SUM32135.1 putative gp48 [Staphylococcus gallinarum]
MIEFKIKNKETGKVSVFTKEEITVGEAETFYELQQKQTKETEKVREKAKNEIEQEFGSDFENKELLNDLIQNRFVELLDGKKLRKMEREFVISLFSDQGLSEEDILKNMGTKTYAKLVDEIFREINGENEEDTNDVSEEVGKTEEQPQ